MADKRTEKKVSGKKTGVNWQRIALLGLIIIAFIIGIMHAGGCGMEKQPETVQQSGQAGQGASAGADNKAVDGKKASEADKETAAKKAGNNGSDSNNEYSAGNSAPVKRTAGKYGPSGRMAIIIDDCGYSSSVLSTLAGIDCPLTFSVIPYLGASGTASAKARASGKQVMLHLPMQSASGASAEKITIMTSMSDNEIKQITRNAINAISGARGVNNHQGSKATANPRVMRAVMSVIAEHGMFFVDSRTNPASVGCDVAREYGVATGENELFLDNSNSVSYIKGQLRKAVELAHNHTIIVIGHARPNTAQAISEMVDEIRESNITLIFASEAVS